MLSANALDPVRAVTPGPELLARDRQLLDTDLSSVSGTLREVATMWRRAAKKRPQLPQVLPVRLDEAARELAQAMAELAGAGQDCPLDRWCAVAERLSALRTEIAAARAQSSGAGGPVGDAGLWDTIDAAMQRAARRLLSLILQVAHDVDWTIAEPPGTGLVIRLR